MKTILAIKNRRLGDTVLWTSSLEALCQMGYTVDIVYPKAYAALFKTDPRFRKSLFYENGPPNSETYDAVLNFHASPSSDKFAKKVPAKKHLIHHHSRDIKTNPSTPSIPGIGKPMKATERDLNLVRALGWTGSVPASKIYSQNLTPEKIVLGIEASRTAKEWPLEYYVKLAKMLMQQNPVAFFVQNVNRYINDPRFKELKKYAEELKTPTLDDVLTQMTKAKLYIGSDSGLKHVAVALGVRTITLFGPESIGEWHCYDGHVALQVPVGCRFQDPEPKEYSWCGADTCPLSSHACLRLIQPEDVVKVL